MRQYYITRTDYTPCKCFPVGLDTSEFVDITTLGSEWRTYIAPDGVIHSCKEYYNQMLKDLENA